MIMRYYAYLFVVFACIVCLVLVYPPCLLICSLVFLVCATVSCSIVFPIDFLIVVSMMSMEA